MATNDKAQPQTTVNDPLLAVYSRLIELAEQQRKQQAETAGKRPKAAEKPGEGRP